ncbi:MAG: hypothetical protein S4CHLAM37_07320 [Chlamydiia bacterium]|nr:hypothetical protein [Chlamydiia bacterium]
MSVLGTQGSTLKININDTCRYCDALLVTRAQQESSEQVELRNVVDVIYHKSCAAEASKEGTDYTFPDNVEIITDRSASASPRSVVDSEVEGGGPVVRQNSGSRESSKPPTPVPDARTDHEEQDDVGPLSPDTSVTTPRREAGYCNSTACRVLAAAAVVIAAYAINAYTS